MSDLQHIVVVGGGAGGLELVTQLGNTLGKNKRAKITLVDSQLTHVWKPLWHEAAAGTLSSGQDEVNYIAHAYKHHFHFVWGQLAGLAAEDKQLILAPADKPSPQILPERRLDYDVLVLATGSISYDFKVPGVKQHCFLLDSYQNCLAFQQHLLQYILQPQAECRIAIVGGGATGVELAAELQYAFQQAADYQHQSAKKVEITVIETASRILTALPETLANAALRELTERGINVVTGEQVVEVSQDAFYTKSGLIIPAELKVWAAGIQASETLSHLALETNARHQLKVRPSLQTTRFDNIFALGDCASCPQADGQWVPPRAQAAHQQAAFLAKAIPKFLHNQPLPAYRYRDYGALISLGQQKTYGNLMGRALGNIMLRGRLARLAYLSLYRKHQVALFGWWKVGLLALAQRLTSIIRPRLKLH